MRKFQMSQTTRDRAEATEKGASLQEAIICLTPETSSVWWQLHYVLGFNVWKVMFGDLNDDKNDEAANENRMIWDYERNGNNTHET